MKFTFKSKFVGFGSPETTMEFEVDQLEDVLAYLKQFLQGCGYTIDGELDVVRWNEESLHEVDMDGRC